ncbi:protein FAM126B isoform X2 [Ischnura elegans]|uniref:protein FAM126B isoform X2 n=1 Tax=Ischnura elegans TaxID=197161 RepID=UPI001ED8734B|nr:protein FAM126B isoform X2 [Ischnura elegans]
MKNSVDYQESGNVETIVGEWIKDWEGVGEGEEHSHAENLAHDVPTASAIHTLLLEERSKHPQLVHDVCAHLLVFYRSKEPPLKTFTLQFIPTLIYVYLNAVAHDDLTGVRDIETLLIALYNLEVLDENGKPKILHFRIPSLAQASIYHEPMSLAPASLTMSALQRLEEVECGRGGGWGPLPPLHGPLTTSRRLPLISSLLTIAFSPSLSSLSPSACHNACRIASRLVTQGFGGNSGTRTQQPPQTHTCLPRIPTSPKLLLEMLHYVYFSMFNGQSHVAMQALEDIHQRGCYELYADVILVTSAIRNSLKVNPSGQPSDGPMGISVAISPATPVSVATVSKSMITNASFRTKKLPDDIPIQSTSAGREGGGDSGGGGGVGGEGGEPRSLVAIAEEGDEGTTVANAPTSSTAGDGNATPSSSKTSVGLRASSLRAARDKALPKLQTAFGSRKKGDKRQGSEKPSSSSAEEAVAEDGSAEQPTVVDKIISALSPMPVSNDAISSNSIAALSSTNASQVAAASILTNGVGAVPGPNDGLGETSNTHRSKTNGSGYPDDIGGEELGGLQV